jgi:hypothetical protein
MKESPHSLERQIEAAFDYRGHVTVVLKGGGSLEGYIYNRQLAGSKLKEEPFIELMVKNGDERRKLRVSELASVSLTGEDCAAGKSFEDHQKKKAAERK